MWPFKSADQRFRQVVEEKYGDYLRSNAFQAEPEGSGRPSHIWGLAFQSSAFRLRINAERGGGLLVSGAPLSPTAAWYEEDWYLLYNVLRWLCPDVPLHSKWAVGPDAASLATTHEALTRFFSQADAGLRERFIESVQAPFLGRDNAP